MKIDDFTLQAESGRLWLDIQERISEKVAIIADLTSENARLTKLLDDAKAAFLAQDFTAIHGLIEVSEQTAKEREIESAKEDVKVAQERLAELQARIAAREGK